MLTIKLTTHKNLIKYLLDNRELCDIWVKQKKNIIIILQHKYKQ